ncbi:MAG: DUF4410 domain-containing protein [Syntrophobacteraceae bacterium]
MFRSRMGFCVFLFSILLLLSGCATVADRSGFLSGYEKLHQGKHLQNYWSSAELTGENVSRIYIAPVEGWNRDESSVTKADACRWLEEAVVSNIQKAPGWKISERPEEYKKNLFMSVTHLDTGSAAGRILAAELGAGHAFVQAEGKLTDSTTNKELASFTDRRRDTGVLGLEDLAGNAGRKLVKRMLEGIASDIVMELSNDLTARN